jgi:cytochrome P450
MIALLMAGQHSSSATLSWMLLNLANKPEIQALLYAEQIRAVGDSKTPLAFEHLAQLPLHQAVVKETLRLHAPIHTILRIVKQPLTVPNTDFVLPKDRIILSSPSVTAQADEHFINAADWNPTRWESMKQSDADEEKTDYGYGTVSKGARSPYLPFGSGIHRW